ncbi:MAG: hypothetical protein AAF799_45840 [Myxococcota bacterium]
MLAQAEHHGAGEDLVRASAPLRQRYRRNAGEGLSCFAFAKVTHSLDEADDELNHAHDQVEDPARHGDPPQRVESQRETVGPEDTCGNVDSAVQRLERVAKEAGQGRELLRRESLRDCYASESQSQRARDVAHGELSNQTATPQVGAQGWVRGEPENRQIRERRGPIERIAAATVEH